MPRATAAGSSSSPWQTLRGQFEELFSLPGAHEYRLEYDQISSSLLSGAHPLGVLHANLLSVFEAQLSSFDDATKEARAMLHVLRDCTLHALYERNPSEADKFAILLTVERTVFRALPTTQLQPAASTEDGEAALLNLGSMFARFVAMISPGDSQQDCDRPGRASQQPPPPQQTLQIHPMEMEPPPLVVEPRLFYYAFAAVAADTHEQDRAFRMRQHEMSETDAAQATTPETASEAEGDSAQWRIVLDERQEDAIASLSQLRTSGAPSVKLNCICRAVSSIASDDAQRACADDLLSSLVQCLLHSDVRAPHAEAAFITAFVHDGVDLSGAFGYCLACFQAASEAASTLTLQQLVGGSADVASSDAQAVGVDGGGVDHTTAPDVQPAHRGLPPPPSTSDELLSDWEVGNLDNHDGSAMSAIVESGFAPPEALASAIEQIAIGSPPPWQDYLRQMNLFGRMIEEPLGKDST